MDSIQSPSKLRFPIGVPMDQNLELMKALGVDPHQISSKCSSIVRACSELQDAIINQHNYSYDLPFEKHTATLSAFLFRQENQTRSCFSQLKDLDFRLKKMPDNALTAVKNMGKHSVAALIDTSYHAIKVLTSFLCLIWYTGKTALLKGLQMTHIITKEERAQKLDLMIKQGAYAICNYAVATITHSSRTARNTLRIIPAFGPYLGYLYDASEIILTDAAKALSRFIYQKLSSSTQVTIMEYVNNQNKI